MTRRRIVSALLLLLLAGICGYIAAPNNGGFHFFGISNDLRLKQGLDLQGGIQFLLQARCPDSNPKCDISKNLDATITNLQNRVNGGLGVSEAVVTSRKDDTSNNYYISVELPGLVDAKQASDLLGSTGLLQIIDTQSNPLQVGTQVTPGQYPVQFTGTDLDPNSIQVSFDQTNRPQINFAMVDAKKNDFANYTQSHVGQYLTVTLDNTVIESAVIQSQITGDGVINGISDLTTANRIASLMRYGSLPLPLSVVSQESIDPTLGAQAIRASETAAIIGLGLVILFMLVYYRLPGLVATLALILYALLTITIIKLIGAVLTLAGIAGVVLSIGMAVDANILIFERVKEEIRAGRTLAQSIEHGWERAWPSIRDSNASTIITCLILMYFGNNFGATIIVGFATNLLIGVLASLFTAVTATRALLNVFLLIPGVLDNAPLFGLPKGLLTRATYRRAPRTTPALAGAAGSALVTDGEEEE